MIRLACPSCGRSLKVKDELAGKRVVCPHCKKRLIVPTSTPSNLFDANTLAPTAELDGEALDFLAPAQGPDELGRLGTYRVLKLLGAGGMGLVLQGQDPLLKRAVALKVMRPELAKSKDARQRFLREARAIAAIEHRHIVSVYQVGEDRGMPFLAMPFLKGESLETRLKREGQLPAAEAVHLGQQIAEGLAAAHKNDLIHRDIKPGNIWLEARDDPRDPRAWVKLLDFGLARADGANERTLTKLGTILGTPGYMPPEQARGEKVDPRCDLFSLGAVLYRMLTGKLPFKGTDTMSQLMSLAEDTPRPVQELNADVPPSLADLVTQLLAKKPDGRPASARAVADALAALEDVSAQQFASLAPERSFTADERAILEEPTRLIQPAAALEDVSAPQFASPPPERSFTAGERAILEEPTRLIQPASVATEGGSPRSLWWIPLAATGAALLGLLVLGLLLPHAAKTPTTPTFSMPAKATTTFPERVKKDRPLPEEKDRPTPAERAKAITNSIGMKLVLVEPGVFLMGSPEKEENHGKDEQQHIVEITRPFYVGVYEVTQEQYERVMDEKPSWFASKGNGEDKVRGMDTNQFPVECVSWEDAVTFCRLLSELPEEKANERLYRLPTEAQWEYACRGGPLIENPSPPFSFGDSLSSAQANFNGKFPYGGATERDPLERTTEVGSYPPNSLGIYDLHGNVWEWCADRYAAEYSGRKDPQGPDNGERRVLRGGSWCLHGKNCRAAYRGDAAPRDRYNVIGFRVVLVAGART